MPTGSRVLVFGLVLGLGMASRARADEVGELLRAGPLIQVQNQENGRLKRVWAMTDMETSCALAWTVLNTQEKFAEFMPRVKRMSVKVENPTQKLVSYVLDTPFMDTSYTLRWTTVGDNQVKAEHVSGDIKGSAYEWTLTPISPAKCRVVHAGITRNFSMVANRLEDASQTISVGVNVVTVLAALNAVKQRAEKSAPAVTPNVTNPSSGGAAP